MYNKRLSSVLVLGLATGVLLTGCSDVDQMRENIAEKQVKKIEDYNYIYQKDNMLKVKYEERASLGNKEDLENYLGKMQLLEDETYIIPEYSGIKGIDTEVQYNKNQDKVLQIEIVGNFNVWKSQTDEKVTWENFLFDFRRLAGFKFEDVLNTNLDTEQSEELIEYVNDFINNTKPDIKDGKEEITIAINDKLSLKVIKETTGSGKTLDTELRIIFNEIQKEVK